MCLQGTPCKCSRDDTKSQPPGLGGVEMRILVMEDDRARSRLRHHLAAMETRVRFHARGLGFPQSFDGNTVSCESDPAGLYSGGRPQAGLGDIGWHTFRHTYRAWLDATGAPLGVQQKLMRHADIRTTTNVYGMR